MTDKETMFLAGILFFILQFAYNVWARSQTQKILDAQNERTDKMIKLGQDQTKEIITAIKTGVDSFRPHTDRSKRIFGIVKDLKHVHEVRDEDGRPMCYMPKEIIETQREMASLHHIIATTQKHTVKLMEKMDLKIDTHMTEYQAVLRNIETKLDIVTSLQEGVLRKDN